MKKRFFIVVGILFFVGCVAVLIAAISIFFAAEPERETEQLYYHLHESYEK